MQFHASRWHRRAGLAAVVALVASLGAGLPDVNGDGRASLADISAAARQVFGVISPAAPLPIMG